jgi:hypothetical protein
MLRELVREHSVLLGTGVANIPGVMRELKKVGFSGLVAIEYEKDTDSNEDMRKQIEYARAIAQESLGKSISALVCGEHRVCRRASSNARNRFAGA